MDSELTPLEKATIVRKENGAVYLNPQEKFEKKPTRATAINAKCYECFGGGHDKGWKWAIGNCTCGDCPLYPFRPYRSFYGKDKPKGMIE